MPQFKLGPSGGKGGQDFGDVIPPGSRITEIHLFTDQYVDALQFTYINARGETKTTTRVGADSGVQHVFKLDDDEYLLGISGSSGWYVDGLRFHTNKRISDLYGSEGGDSEFQYEAPPHAQIVGLFGRAAGHVDAIGVITRDLPQSVAPTQDDEEKTRLKNMQKIEGVGPKTALLLSEKGIPDLQTLAKTPVERLQAILKEAGSRYLLADPTTWPEQAALGAKGDWEALETLKAELHKGRRT